MLNLKIYNFLSGNNTGLEPELEPKINNFGSATLVPVPHIVPVPALFTSTGMLYLLVFYFVA